MSYSPRWLLQLLIRIFEEYIKDIEFQKIKIYIYIQDIPVPDQVQRCRPNPI